MNESERKTGHVNQGEINSKTRGAFVSMTLFLFLIIIPYFKWQKNIQTYYSERRKVKFLRDECALVQNVCINPRRKTVSVSAVKLVLYLHGLGGYSVRQKLLLAKSYITFGNARRDSNFSFWRHI
uniref:Uncharacterized protein n=1 Tax=Xiphophorus maculatus TaxID=8083 RepID=A0A3B5RFB7_XIPMA